MGRLQVTLTVAAPPWLRRMSSPCVSTSPRVLSCRSALCLELILVNKLDNNPNNLDNPANPASPDNHDNNDNPDNNRNNA